MNKTLWKLEKIGDRLWTLARLSATQAAALARDGKGLAVVAEETRNMADKVDEAVEMARFEGNEVNKDLFVSLALELNLLALNSALESYRLGYLGKQAAVCAEDIRNLAYEIVCIFDKETADRARQYAHPWPKYPLTSMNKCEYLHLDINGINVLEHLDFIKEVCRITDRGESGVSLRGMEIPFVDGYLMSGGKQETPVYVIIQTPWAEQNKSYAVAANVKSIHLCPVGRGMDAPVDMPLAKYVRECWESEDGEPFYFMDWPKMAL